MKKIILIIGGILLFCAGGFVILINYHFTGLRSLLDLYNYINAPLWALLIISSLLSAVAGIVMVIKGLYSFII